MAADNYLLNEISCYGNNNVFHFIVFLENIYAQSQPVSELKPVL